MSLTASSHQLRLNPLMSAPPRAPALRPRAGAAPVAPAPPSHSQEESEEEEGSSVSEEPSEDVDAAAALARADVTEARLLQGLKEHGRHFSKIAGRYTF